MMKTKTYFVSLTAEIKKYAVMKKAIWTLVLFLFILLAVTSPMAGLAGIMLFLLGAALLWTVWTFIEVLVSGESKEPSP